MTHHNMTDYMAHGFCLLWEPALVRLHVISDIATGLAYYSIPVAIFYFLYKRRDLPFPGMFVLFGIFILACGTTHLLAAYTIYKPAYWSQGVMKAFTALVSVVSAVLFIPYMPKAIALPSLTKALEEIKTLNTTLERQMGELRLFRNLLDQANDSVFVIDPETGRFIDGNAMACSNLGCERDELLKMNIFDIQSEIPDTSSWKAHVDEVRNKRHLGLEGSNRRKNGTTFPVDVNVSYVLIGQRDYLVAVVRDITERKKAADQLRENAQRLKVALSGIDIAVFNQDRDLRYTWIYQAQLGYTPDEVIGRTDIQLLPKETAENVSRIKRDVMEKNSGAREEVSVILNDKKFVYDLIVEPLLNVSGDVVGITGASLDITERKKAEERIQRQLQKLSSLHTIDLTISSSLDIRMTLKVFINHAITQLDVDAATVLLLNPSTRTLDYAASQGFRTSALRHSHLRLGEGYAGIAALENRIVNIHNLKEEDNIFMHMESLKGEDFITYYGVPPVAKGNVKGVLEIFHRSPLNPDEEWFDFLDALALQAAIAIDNNSLFYSLERSNMDITLAYDRTIEGWSRALDYRDKETEGHSKRVTEMTLRIAREMGMTEEELVHVGRGALLHDIGKMGIPDSILLKPGALTDEEWKIMRLHPVYCHELLNPIEYLRPALDIPYCHHEKWDGSGYPRRLKGEQIPLSARIFAVVDVWDALCSDRPYRLAWSEEKAREHILSLSGIEFDPKVVEAFVRAITERKISSPARGEMREE